MLVVSKLGIRKPLQQCDIIATSLRCSFRDNDVYMFQAIHFHFWLLIDENLFNRTIKFRPINCTDITVLV